jgi:hypothetical protein
MSRLGAAAAATDATVDSHASARRARGTLEFKDLATGSGKIMAE